MEQPSKVQAPPVPSPEPGIECSMEGLTNYIDKLVNVIDTFKTRLKPICNSTTPESESPPSRDSVCELSQRLDEQAYRVALCTHSLSYLLDQLEL